MSGCCCCCGTFTVNGQPVGGNGGGSASAAALWTVDVDIVQTAIFPAVNRIDIPIAANFLAADGDQLYFRIGGLADNQTGGGTQWVPSFEVGGVPGWIDISTNAPVGTFPFFIDLVATRKSALTFTMQGRVFLNDSLVLPILGFGDIQLPTNGTPISSVEADLACDWSIVQNFTFANTSIAGPGNRWIIKSGALLPIFAP